HAVSGTGQAGCRAPAAGGRGGRGATSITNSSAGRFPDGRDTDSNCNDFVTQAATVLPAGAARGGNNLKVQGITDFAPGQTITVGAGPDVEIARIAAVGTGGFVKSAGPVRAGETAISIEIPNPGAVNQLGFVNGQSIVIGEGADSETATLVAAQGGPGGPRIAIAQPLRLGHPAGTPISGTGITLESKLSKTYPANAQIATDAPTPGAPNRYSNHR
ncbi:MAG: hypothetical protein ABIW31_00745, partial [Novosphingobium sp.]